MPSSLEELGRYVRFPKRWKRGNRAQCRHDGRDGLESMLQAIRGAQRAVLMEFYIFRDDATGHRFADALVDRAQAGVDVKVIVDAWGNLDVDAGFYEGMRAGGVKLLVYGPVTFFSAFRGPGRRNHRKVLVVDHQVAFVGGLNIADDYASLERGGLGWRDTLVELRGPVVHDLTRLTLNAFERARGERAAAPRPRAPAPLDDDTWVAILSNSELGQRLRIRRSYLQAIKAARQTITIANAYYLPGRTVRRALERAVRRGVVVKVIVPKHSDIRVVGWATRHLFSRMLRRGIQVYEWTESMLHAKVAVVDEVWSTVGSYNMDQRSLRDNLEVNAVVLDTEFGRGLYADLEADTRRSERVSLEVWSRRSLIERLRAWFFFQFRAFM